MRSFSQTSRFCSVRSSAGRSPHREFLFSRCAQCHLANYAGFNQILRLAGQIPHYLVAQLRAFRSGSRSDDTGTMGTLLAPISDEDLENLSHYFASLGE